MKNKPVKHFRGKVRHQKRMGSKTTVKMKQADDALTHDAAILDNPEDDDQDLIGPSVLKNMEISIVHVLPAEF
ncbi:hypothetical protein ACFX1S_044290 [Malus domestica]